jgi:hypothetical protein
MKKIEYISMLLAVGTTLFSIALNLKSGFTAYSWQLCTLLWIGTAYIKTKRLENLEKQNQDF